MSTLLYPDLIASAPANYKGMREACAPNWTWRFSTKDVKVATGYSGACWHNWHLSGNGMPRSVSAYMALLCDAHPFYQLRKRREFPRAAVFGQQYSWPPIPAVEPVVVLEFLERHSVTRLELVEAFAFDDSKPPPIDALGNCGVRWAMLSLMADEHPYLAIYSRGTAPEDEQ